LAVAAAAVHSNESLSKERKSIDEDQRSKGGCTCLHERLELDPCCDLLLGTKQKQHGHRRADCLIGLESIGRLFVVFLLGRRDLAAGDRIISKRLRSTMLLLGQETANKTPT